MGIVSVQKGPTMQEDWVPGDLIQLDCFIPYQPRYPTREEISYIPIYLNARVETEQMGMKRLVE